MAWSDNSFEINPYIVVSDNKKLTLAFRSLKGQAMSVRLKKNSTDEWFKPAASDIWSDSVLTKINIGTLKCGEELHYSVTPVGEQKTSDIGLYAIPCDPSETFYFGFMSDTQIKNSAGQIRATQLANTVDSLRNFYPFSLVVNAGDIVQNGGVESEWLNFFNMAQGYLSKSYLMAAVGNHEYYSAPTMNKAPSLFMKYMRNDQDPDLGNIAVDAGNVNLLMINSNFASMSETKIQDQWLWLKGKLQVAQNLNKASIIVLHHSPYSASIEHLRSIPRRLRREFVPLIEAHKGVKLVLSGHLHMYERSIKKGIHYLTAGPSGGINNLITYRNPYSVFIRTLTTTFSILAVTPENIEIITYSGDQKIFDTLKIPLNI